MTTRPAYMEGPLPPEVFGHEQRVKAQRPSSPAKTAEPLDLRLLVVPSMAELSGVKAPPRTWFFDQVIPAGAFLIVGRPKIGKSWLLLQLALAAARGAPFLGYESLGSTEALYIAAEDDLARVQERFAIIGGGDPPENLRLILAEQFRQLAEEYSQQANLAEFIDAYLGNNPTTKMVIIDTEATCRAIWDGEGDRRAEVKARDYAETREFDRIGLKHRAFVGLVNHSSKRRGTGYIDLHELVNRTNVALAGASGSIVLADPPDRQVGDDEDKRRVLGIRGRDLRDDVLLAIEQQQDASFRSLGAWTAVAATDAERAILEAAVDINRDAPGSWITAKAIAAALEKSPGAVQRTISRMLKAGRTTWDGHRIETSASKGLRLVSAYGEARG